jgi:hypothetical protein
MTRQGSDEVMTEAAAAGEEEETMEQENLEDIAALLDSVHIFTSSSSQIPTQQKSLVLQDLVKLSLPNVNIYQKRYSGQWQLADFFQLYI